jgi:hypothetical protein
MPRAKSITVITSLSVVFGALSSAWAQLGVPVTAPAALNTSAASDGGDDYQPQLATDGAGNWVAVWESIDDLGGTIATENDNLVARSTDSGASWSAPQPLNTNAASDTGLDYSPQLTTDGAGHWVAVWGSDEDLGGTLGTDLDVLVTRSTDNGATWSAPQPLNTNADTDSGHDGNPQVATDGAGNWMAVWDSDDNLGGTIGTDIDVLVSRSTDNGATWSAPQALNASAPSDSGDDRYPRLTTDRAGNWVAVWASDDNLGATIGTDRDVLVARSSDNGATWSAPQPLNTNAASDIGDDGDSQVTTDSAGNWVALWESDDDLGGTIGADHDILFARSTDNGSTWSPPQALNTDAASDSEDDFDARLATDGLGNWVAVWTSSHDLGVTPDPDTDILAARSADGAVTWSMPEDLNTNAASDSGSDYDPQLTTDGAGNWVAVWRSYDDLGGTIGTDSDILVARFALPDCDANGVPDSSQPDSDGDGTIDACEGPCGCGATSAVMMSLWALSMVKLSRRRKPHYPARRE